MEVTTWKGGTLGIYVGKKNAKDYFNKSWDSINVKIGNQIHTFKLSDTFWTTCPEFRGDPIPTWLKNIGLDKWSVNHPHSLILNPLGGNNFELIK
jgi:hypothetical protein